MSQQHEEESSIEQNFEVAQELTSNENLNKLNYWTNLIVEGIEEALFSLNRNWQFTYLNSKVATIWNRPKETLLGKVMWEEFPILIGSELENFYRQAMANGKPDRMETFAPITQSWYDVRIYSIPQGLIVFFEDITRRKQLEQALYESEARYRGLSEATFEGIVIHQNGIIMEANQTAVQMVGYNSPEELIGQSLFPLVAPEHRDTIKKRIAENSLEPNEVVGIRKDGSRFLVEIRANVIEYRGQTVRVVAFRDITERVQKEQALRESEYRFKVLSGATREGILIHRDGILIEANESMAHIFGYTNPEELLGCSVFELLASQNTVDAQKRVREGSEEVYEVIASKKDGSSFALEVSGKNIEYQGYAARQIAIRDITERKQAEENLRKTQAQLLQAQKMESVGRLAGGVAHDFNNLLTAITGYSELLLLSLDEEDPCHNDVIEIQRAANQAAALTRQLLAFSRQQVMQPKIISLNEIVTDMGKLLQRLIGEDIELSSLLDPDLGEVLADPGQIEQVIVNLAVNARDAMPNGGKLAIETANVELDERYPSAGQPPFKSGSYVMLAVSDTGLGMDQITQEKIFEPFFTTKEIGKGTGLGLSTVYGIVNQSQGYIQVYSEIQAGTIFKVYLPRANSLVANDERKIQPVAHSENSKLNANKVGEVALESGDRGQGYTVLIVEDDSAVRELIHRVLAEAGYIILEAYNGEQALELLKDYAGKIDLVLTDIVMPQMGGQALISQLKESQRKLKIVCMSGYTDRAITSHKTLQEWDAFIQKPFSPTTLLSRLEEILRPSS